MLQSSKVFGANTGCFKDFMERTLWQVARMNRHDDAFSIVAHEEMMAAGNMIKHKAVRHEDF